MASVNNRHKLLYHQTPTSQPHPLPQNITRHLIPTLRGPLELLYAQPPDSVHHHSQVLFFQHGGFGHAAVWLPYLSYFASRGYTGYALSLRGHGSSWHPRFLEMVWGTGVAAMREDFQRGVEWVKEFENGKRKEGFEDEDLIVVGHSAGGGLVQGSLGRGEVRVGGLVLVAAFPFTGGYVFSSFSYFQVSSC
jgi:pimeloyl-ACP methyl ester carboxylesterase